mmetsp:Transcript_12182/g.25559  ORF Transcript_12182/g.25559 Transcript_12182/m.25559 type:complete len:123 (-) Transcript_12182:1012-1380(-)
MSARNVLRLGGAAASASSSWGSVLSGSFCLSGVAAVAQRRFAATSSGSKLNAFELETPELSSDNKTVEELRNLEGSRLNWKAATGGEAQESQEIGSKELGGPKGPEPTRYTDWEVGGRVSDF